MRLFGVTAFYSFRALFHWLSPMPYLVYRALFPLAQLAFFALIGTYGGSQPLSFYLVGNAIGTATATAFGVSQAVGNERQQGTLDISSRRRHRAFPFSSAARHSTSQTGCSIW